MPFEKGNQLWLGRHHTQETKRRISLANKGERHSPATEFKKGIASWNKGGHISEEHKQKLSTIVQAQLAKERTLGIKRLKHIGGRKNPNWRGGNYSKCEICGNKFWVMPFKKGIAHYCSGECRAIGIGIQQRGQANPNWRGGYYKECPVCGREFWAVPSLKRKYCSRPCFYIGREMWPKSINKIEKRLLALLDRWFPGEWEYVGDGQIKIGKLYPDFMNVNGKKQVIELFGDYWHSPRVIGNNWRKGELGRIMAFSHYGFKALIIWEHELTDERALFDKVKHFSLGRC